MIIFEDQDAIIHFGVKGMKWGVRRTRRIQRRLDRTAKIRDRTATKGERVVNVLGGGAATSKGAGRILRRGAALQKTINDGDAFVTDLLLKVQGVRVRDLDYRQA